MVKELNLMLRKGGVSTPTTVPLHWCVIAGWTGRDQDEVQRHIDELARLGVRPPTSTPVFYRVSAARVTTADEIQVLGPHSGGEAECVVLGFAGECWVGVGSDHTDRSVETYDVGVSKQMCEKPVGSTFWRLSDIADHWDELRLESYLTEGSDRSLYQQGTVDAMLSPLQLMAKCFGEQKMPDGTVMFCGTLPVKGGIRSGSRFEVALHDPRSGDTISHRYDVRPLATAA